MTLAAQMIERGDLNELPYERFWREIGKAFEDGPPAKFFELLYELGAFEDVRFFKEMFGGTMKGSVFARIMHLSTECHAFGPELGVDLFSAIVAPEATSSFFNTSRAGSIFIGLHSLKRLSRPPTALELVQFWTRCRAWGTGTMADDVIQAVRLVELVCGARSEFYSSEKLQLSLDAARSVTSAPFSHLVGKLIGEAMTAERVQRVQTLLT